MFSKSRIKMGRYEAKWQSDEEDIQEGSLNGGGVARLNLEEEILTSFSSLLHFPENKAEQGSLWRSFTGTQDFVVEPTPATRPERQFVYVNIHYILFILVAMKLNTFFRSRLLPFHPILRLPHRLLIFLAPSSFLSFSHSPSSHFGCAPKAKQATSQPVRTSVPREQTFPSQIIIIPTTTSNYISVKLICKFLC